MIWRYLFAVVLTTCFYCHANAQFPFAYKGVDSLYINSLLNGMKRSFFVSPDSVTYYAELTIKAAEKYQNDTLSIYAKQTGGEGYRGLGKFTKSLQLQLEALQESRKIKDRYREGYSYSFLGFTYVLSGYPEHALTYLKPAYLILDSCKDWIQSSFSAANTALAFTMLNQIDSANRYNNIALMRWEKADSTQLRRNALRTLILNRFATTFEQSGDYKEALKFYNHAYRLALRDNIGINVSLGQVNLAKMHLRLGHLDSAKFYALSSFAETTMLNQIPNKLESAIVLDSVYRRLGKTDSALLFASLSIHLKDSLFGPKSFRELQFLMAEDQENQMNARIESQASKTRQRTLLMGLGLMALLLVVLSLRRGNRIKQRLNQELNAKNKDLETTLTKLKSTQTQLIQSEKMASLGELTAGIAHEIQNPLNFVNNFSDVNQELIDELKEELQKGDLREASAIADNLKENEAKINLHGKRADGIVKSMLQHSRGSSGLKEPTDVNKLVDEYIRLAFHGYRAKVKDFNVDLDINLDPLTGSVPMVRQDIGRVILNLLNNAFYAVMEKGNNNTPLYKPTVSIHTKRENNAVIIEITDNGSGIPEDKRAKIFQPFFTTKPTGEGTGLGLSLSYDIITKGHGGSITCDTKPNEYTKFIITLPSDAS